MKKIHFAMLMFSVSMGMATAEEPADAGANVHLFYFDGRIVEDGLPAIHPTFGEYQFTDIVTALDRPGISLHAKQRGPDADVEAEAMEAVTAINALIASGVPADHIAIVGASKGSLIASRVSHELGDRQMKLVILAGCWPSMVETLIANEQFVFGDVLEVRDIEDKGLEPGCGELIDSSPGVTRHKAIVTELGVSHGLIYRPYKEWLEPTLEWVAAE